MCVIAYKPIGTMFPSKKILKNCFENNSHGAGFMYAFNNKVHLQKGYSSFETFFKALKKARNKTGDDVPYVMHFRIATQGYDRSMTHPFPLSRKMDDLKKFRFDTDIGVAHNGILDITSDGAKDYSDTMKFITDYLSLIIKGKNWYQKKDSVELIENLIDGSRLAILDKNSHCELLGKGWIEDEGCWYSNTSYSYKKPSQSNSWQHILWGNYYGSSLYDDDWNLYDDDWNESHIEYEKFYNHKTGLYDFDNQNCPAVIEFDDSYCETCSRFGNCPYSCAEFYYDDKSYKDDPEQIAI